MRKISAVLRRPGRNVDIPSRAIHYGFAISGAGSSGKRHAHPVHLQSGKSIDAVLNGPLVTPAHQPVSGCAVEEIMLTRSFPDKMPGIGRVDAEWTSQMLLCGCECSGVVVRLLTRFHRDVKSVTTDLRRHEADTVEAAIR